MRLKIFATVLISFINCGLWAQQFKFGTVQSNYAYRHFTVADGLPQIQATFLFCDSKGFVWVGTKFGVARWDGKQFKEFTLKEGAAGTQVTSITELKDGTIAVFWQSDAFNLIRGNTVRRIATPVHWQLKNISFGTVLDSNRLLLISNMFGNELQYKRSLAAVYNTSTNRFERETWYQQWNVVAADSNGYVVTTDLQTQAVSTNRFFVYRYNRLLQTVTMPKAWQFMQNMQNGRCAFFFPQQPNVRFVPEVNNNRFVWKTSAISFQQQVDERTYYFHYSAGDSLLLYSNQRQELFAVRGEQEVSLGKTPLSNFKLLDKEGNIWVATEGGVYCFYKLGIQELQFNRNKPAPDNIWSMATDGNGNYYYSSYSNGIWYSADANKTWRTLLPIKSTRNNLMQNGSFGMRCLQNGDLFIPTLSGFHYLQKGELHSWDLYGIGAEIYASWEDTLRQQLYISKHNIVFRLHTKTLQLDTVFKSPEHGLQSVLHITGNASGEPVLSGKGTPLVLKNGRWQPIAGAEGIKARSSCADAWGGLWLGGVQQLTVVRNGKAIDLKQLPCKQLVLSLTTWGKKWLVIGGSYELVFLDLEQFYKTGKELYQYFDAGSGLLITEGGQNAFVHDKDGSIWWPCQNKVVRFWPEKLLGNEALIKSPALLLAKATNNNTDVQKEIPVTNEQQEVKLESGFRNLEFTFSTAAMNNNNNLQYRYKLEGYQTNWSVPSSAGTASFTGIAAGKYRLVVQASFNGDKWSMASLSPLYIVPSFWYETVAAKLILLFSLLALVIIVTRWYDLQKQKQDIQKRKLAELQLKAIHSKSIPHFSGNAFANIDYYIEKGDTANASKYLAILSRLYTITLQDSDKTARTIAEEINYTELYLQMEKLRFDDKINYCINVNEHIPMQTKVPVMLLHTLAENAIKHGLKNKATNGLLTIDVLNTGSGICVQVTDDGIGRTAAAMYNSNSTKQGLEILQQQIAILNSVNKQPITMEVHDLKSSNGEAAGTSFIVHIPTKYSYSL